MKRLLRKGFCVSRVACVAATGLVLAAPAFAQANSPWENAVNVLQTAFTSTIARGLSLVAIVVAGLTFAYRAIKTNVGDSVNVVVHLERRPGRRFVSEVVEIHGYDPDRDEYNYGFIFDCHKELV
jgi:type IV secretory pathway VirB2 component (pilin)